MNNLEESLAKLSSSASLKPQIFDLTNVAQAAEFEALVASGAVKQVSDDYQEQQRELYAIRNPSAVYAPGFEDAFQTYFRTLSADRPLSHDGRWVYYPWRFLVAHVLPEEEYRIVRTARNRNLITEEEQKKFYEAKIGIAGLSVGSSVAFALALSGGPKHMKLADMDHLALSNTNRVLAGAESLGMLKVEMAARRIYEINPYADLELFPDGLTESNIGQFFEGIDIIVDEIDNLAIKYLIRDEAHKRHLPIVMAADNGDNALVEVERHDGATAPEYFHGRMGEVSYEMLKSLDKFGIGRLITKWVGADTVTLRMQESLKEMGKTIVSWPQLGIAAMLNGAAVAYCVRRILNDQPLITDRTLINMDAQFDPEYNTDEARKHRSEAAAAFAKGFGL